MDALLEASPRIQLWTVIVLLGVLFAVVRALMRKDADGKSAFNFDDILLEYDSRAMRDRVSIVRCLAIGAFVYTVWQMVTLTLMEKMTEGYFAAFNLAWVAPLLAQIVWGKRLPLPVAGPTTTIDANNVTVKQ